MILIVFVCIRAVTVADLFYLPYRTVILLYLLVDVAMLVKM